MQNGRKRFIAEKCRRGDLKQVGGNLSERSSSPMSVKRNMNLQVSRKFSEAAKRGRLDD